MWTEWHPGMRSNNKQWHAWHEDNKQKCPCQSVEVSIFLFHFIPKQCVKLRGFKINSKHFNNNFEKRSLIFNRLRTSIWEQESTFKGQPYYIIYNLGGV